MPPRSYSKAYTLDQVQEILSDSANKTFATFVEKKVKDLFPLPKELAELWLVHLFKVWLGAKLFHEVSVNKRKMSMVFSTYNKAFFGFGFQVIPQRPVLENFRTVIKIELKELNAKASEARKKHVASQKQSAVSEPFDYCNLEMAKLWNKR